jgi:DNA-binding NarL/FixJ family response regulator
MPWVKVLAAGADARSQDISRSVFEGADGFVDKTLECEVFLRAIRDLQRGSLLLETTDDLDAGDVLRDLEGQKQVANLLSEREREILLLAADGLTAKQIGVSLGLSDRTVTTHFGRIYSKLGVNSRLGAIRAATRCGAISSPTLVS